MRQAQAVGIGELVSGKALTVLLSEDPTRGSAVVSCMAADNISCKLPRRCVFLGTSFPGSLLFGRVGTRLLNDWIRLSWCRRLVSSRSHTLIQIRYCKTMGPILSPEVPSEKRERKVGNRKKNGNGKKVRKRPLRRKEEPIPTSELLPGGNACLLVPPCYKNKHHRIVSYPPYEPRSAPVMNSNQTIPYWAGFINSSYLLHFFFPIAGANSAVEEADTAEQEEWSTTRLNKSTNTVFSHKRAKELRERISPKQEPIIKGSWQQTEKTVL